MNILWIALIIYGVIAVVYAFRLTLKYFTHLEGQGVGNGTIITSAIAAGAIWGVTLVLDGVRGVWSELAPVKIVPVIVPEAPFDPNEPITDLGALTQRAAAENLNPPRVYGQ
jgi:hypothetical protein